MEMIDVEVNLGSELAAKVNKMTKKELIEHFVVSALRGRVQDETINELEVKNSNLRDTADVCRRDLRQARNIIAAAMDSWYL